MISYLGLPNSRFFALFLSALVALGPLSIDIYLPAIALISQDFNASYAAVNLTISAFLIGNGVGQLIGGPLSDQIGRKSIGLFGLSVYLIATLAIIFSSIIDAVQVLRFLQGFGAGFAAVICIAQIRDVFPPEQVTKHYSNVLVVMLVAPMVAPLIGWVLILLGWQALFFFLAVYSLLILIVYFLLVPETKQVLAARVEFGGLLLGYWKAANHRIDGRITAIRYAMFSTFTAAIFMCFLTNSAMIFMDYFLLNELQFALVFASVGLSLLVGNRISYQLAQRMSVIQWLKKTNGLQLLLIAGLIVLNTVGVNNVWLIAPLILIVLAIGGAIVPIVSGAYISFFDEVSGSASALLTVMVLGVGGLVGAFAVVVTNDGIMPIFVVMMACAIIARMVLITIREPVLPY